MEFNTLHVINMQAQHDTEAAQIAQAVRSAACLPLLALPPAHRTPQRLTLLSHLTNSLQVGLCNQSRHSTCLVPCIASTALLCMH